MRHRRIAALVVSLALVTGCSGGLDGTLLSGPPPSGAVIAWADTVCAKVKLVDDLRTQRKEYSDDTYFAFGVKSEVDSVRTELEELAPSGIKPADAYVTGLTRELKKLSDRFPDKGPQPKAAKVIEFLKGFGKQEPELARLAGMTTALSASYHLAPACTPLKQPPSMSTLANRKLVVWADTMCESSTSLGELAKPGDEPLLKDPRFAPFEDVELSRYLQGVTTDIETIEEELGKVPATGDAAIDGYRKSLLAALRKAQAKLPAEDEVPEIFDTAIAEFREHARRAASAVSSIKPDGPELATFVRTRPALAESQRLAPGCAPSEGTTADEPLPTANDGTNTASCADGKCQIEVSDPVDVTARGIKFTIAVSGGRFWLTGNTFNSVSTSWGYVMVSDQRGLIQIDGAGESGEIGAGGTKVAFDITEMNDTTAIVTFS